ncbi:sugar phosphate isomerase/epimerase (plasmid) [Halorussus salilacus]|uniref:sugar phosphate isomerase/epimerase family protein n=1 Tax=Halorussus salilacus TaxID=2953750 RepID=UPI00209D2E04|nr:TIM barrel protein [Halorussus salilacus]USZ70128.1 sugar phosphate isomerase/epimerase [Halorussus salilacus]
MNIGVISGEVGDTDEVLDFWRQTDIDHVEVRMVDGDNVANLSLETVEVVANRFDEIGIDVPCVASPILKTSLVGGDDNPSEYVNYDAKFGVSEQRELADDIGEKANLLGADYVRIFSGWNEDCDWEETLPPLLESVSSILSEYGIQPLLELDHMCNVTTYEQFERISDRVSGDVGVLFDPGNYVLSGRDDVLAELDRIGDGVTHVHVKDVADGECVPLGEGDIPYAELLRRMTEYGIESLSLEALNVDVEMKSEVRKLLELLPDTAQ